MGQVRRFVARALSKRAVAVAWGTLLLLACGNSSRPHPLGDSVDPAFVDSAEGGSSPSLIGTAASVPTCNLGPNGGVCACVDQPLLTDPPNLYFILDRSSSMNDDNKWTTIISVVGKLMIDLGPRAVVGAAVFPAPVLGDGCNPGVEVFAPQRGDTPAGEPGPVADGFLATLGRITALGGTPTAATIAGLQSYLQSLGGKTYVILATDGGPNCNPNASCDTANCQSNIESAPGCSPSGPNCCTSAMQFGPDECLDADPTVAAVAAVAAAGIPVYVVGVPGSGPYADVLDRLAVAGGTGRGAEPQYYDVSQADQASFQAVLFQVAAKVTASCTLVLNSEPPDSTLVNVFFDEAPVSQAGPDGWTITGDTVTLLGASCQKVEAGDVLDVRVVAGCPTVIK